MLFEALAAFEQRVSSDRRERFDRLDALSAELVRRYRVGEADRHARLKICSASRHVSSRRSRSAPEFARPHGSSRRGDRDRPSVRSWTCSPADGAGITRGPPGYRSRRCATCRDDLAPHVAAAPARCRRQWGHERVRARVGLGARPGGHRLHDVHPGRSCRSAARGARRTRPSRGAHRSRARTTCRRRRSPMSPRRSAPVCSTGSTSTSSPTSSMPTTG